MGFYSHIFIFFLDFFLCCYSWRQDPKPALKFSIDNDRNFTIFVSKAVGGEVFNVLYTDGAVDSSPIVFGGRDKLYALTVIDGRLVVRTLLEWHSAQPTQRKCYIRGYKLAHCHNFITVYQPLANGSMYVCGTNSFQPICRHFTDIEARSATTILPDQRQFGYFPNNPYDNYTYVISEGTILIGVSDQRDRRIIYRKHLQTNHEMISQLNDPEFVYSFEYGNHIYIFLREIVLTEHSRRIVSRVSRVCKHDKGGVASFRHFWTSFQKARLLCYSKGDVDFTFDQLQHVHILSNSALSALENRSETVVYALFTTPHNSFPASAVCVYRMQDIVALFHANASIDLYHEPEVIAAVDECSPSRAPVADQVANYLATHSLVYQSATPFLRNPIFTRTSYRTHSDDRFYRSLYVHPIRDRSGMLSDMIYSVSDNGTLMRVSVRLANEIPFEPVTRLHSEIDLFRVLSVDDRSASQTASTSLPRLPAASRVRRLFVVNSTLVLFTHSKLIGLPLSMCGHAHSQAPPLASLCAQCVALRDPLCGWSVSQAACVHARDWHTPDIIQHLSAGNDSRCGQLSAPAKQTLQRLQLYDVAMETTPSTPSVTSHITMDTSAPVANLSSLELMLARVRSSTAPSSRATVNEASYNLVLVVGTIAFLGSFLVGVLLGAWAGWRRCVWTKSQRGGAAALIARDQGDAGTLKTGCMYSMRSLERQYNQLLSEQQRQRCQTAVGAANNNSMGAALYSNGELLQPLGGCGVGCDDLGKYDNRYDVGTNNGKSLSDSLTSNSAKLINLYVNSTGGVHTPGQGADKNIYTTSERPTHKVRKMYL